MAAADVSDMLSLAEDAVAHVHGVRTSGERLLEALADAGATTPSQLAQQVPQQSACEAA